MKKPSFWRALIAYSIDVMILLSLSLMWLGLWKSFLLVHHTWWVNAPLLISRLGLLSWIGLLAGYFAFWERKDKGSLGKKIVKLKIQSISHARLRCFFAYAIDLGLFVVVAHYYEAYRIQYLLSQGADPEIGLLVMWEVFLGGMIIFVVYFSILEHLFGKTLGKKLMGLQVVQVASAKKDK